MTSPILKTIKRFGLQSPAKAITKWKRDLILPSIEKGNVLITAFRNGTWIEWAVYSAFVLKQMGYNSTLLFKKSETDKQYKSGDFWKSVSTTPFIKLVDIESFEPDQDIVQQYQESEPDFLYDAIAYNYHIERDDVKNQGALYYPDIHNLILESGRAYKAIVTELNTCHYHRFICYSGLIQFTPTLLRAARELGVETVCVEGWAWRAGHVIYNFNQPALEYNLKGWMNYYGWGENQNKAIEEYMSFQNGHSAKGVTWLNKFYNVQQSNINDQVSPSIQSFLKNNKRSFLLAPNVIGDSSTLNKETIFESIKTWMEEVIQYFKVNKQHSLIIRAHPAEVWAKSKVKTRLGDFAEELSKGCENILVIKGEEKVNSFYLMPYVKCGLIWVSSIGVDLVLRGIPVICAASPPYKTLGFAREPKSRQEYFDLVDKFAHHDLISTTEEEKLAAKKYLFVVFKGFSFPAQGEDFTAKTLKLNRMPFQEEHDRFYKILVGENERPDASN